MFSSSLQDQAELITCDCVGAVVGPGRPVIDLLPRRVEPAGRDLVDELGVDELQRRASILSPALLHPL
jgi:hypothetical protein